ncbi:hypothetical protein HIM_09958 [Hirsutella minnesotensis 3608]|uniref:Uncharacterized protein n=1 Tax=Hirsutella minnesotensis 3608 TaxID=1043627 RepID=A0A0F7ZS28_9HYPO|nr:hypothetical protein HIM_09958 [Hirsutella minnesotensis 3608]
MLLEAKCLIHDDSQQLHIFLRLDIIPSDGERRVAVAFCDACEVDDGRLVHFKRGAAALLPLERIIDNRLNTISVRLGRWSSDPGRVVVHEGDGAAVVTDSPLHQVRIEEQKCHQ